MTRQLDIWTDGACQPNPGAGSWAYIVKEDGQTVATASGSDSATTCNRMELTAIAEAIQAATAIDPDASITLRTDSTYCQMGICEWMYGWALNGWKLGKKKPVKNADLWQMISELRLAHSGKIEVRWISRNENTEADALAAQALANPV